MAVGVGEAAWTTVTGGESFKELRTQGVKISKNED